MEITPLFEGFFIGLGVYTLSQILSNTFSTTLNKSANEGSERAYSMEHLEKMVNEERERMGISGDTKIEITLDGEPGCSAICKHKDYYKLNITSEEAERMTIRHELFHLKDNHLGRKFTKINFVNSFINDLFYTLYAEPKTAIYCLRSKKEGKF